jgi:hypothetical protein
VVTAGVQTTNGKPKLVGHPFQMFFSLVNQQALPTGVLPGTELTKVRIGEGLGHIFRPVLHFVHPVRIVQPTHVTIQVDFSFELSTTGLARKGIAVGMHQLVFFQSIGSLEDLVADVTSPRLVAVFFPQMFAKNVEFWVFFAADSAGKLPIDAMSLSVHLHFPRFGQTQQANWAFEKASN